jgi:Kdo2-lipid IVA lauroyltransferase/acyltransferase
MLGLFKFFSVLPLWFAHSVGWLLGWLAFGLSGTYRHRFLENARQAGLTPWQWWGAVGAAGKQIAELPRLWFGRPVPVLWEGAHHIDAALAAGRGILFLTPHLGCFEVAAQAYAERYGQAGHPITVLFRPPRKAWLVELVTSARSRPGLATAPTTLAGVKQLIKALKNGECVGLLPDQVPPAGQGIWSPFFGRQAYTMTLAVRLALQTRAGIVVAWGERLSWGRGYRVHFSELTPAGGGGGPGTLPGQAPAKALGLAHDLEGAVRQVNAAMETLIRSCPQQYLWAYARYKQPKAET